MIRVRPAADRGRGDHGWLDTRHTFSFADYYDPAHLGFRALRVLNEDRVAPGHGFGTHGHRDMEILSFVLSGRLAHKDSGGNGATLGPGEVQRITAGTGILHSEANPSADEPVHFYQVWLLPEARGLPPGYEQKALPAEGRRGRWQLAASHDGRDGSVVVRQDAAVWLADLDAGDRLAYPLAAGRHAWLQVLHGAVTANGRPLAAGDGLAASDEPSLDVAASGPAAVMLFDLA